jgi:hypothetical protein
MSKQWLSASIGVGISNLAALMLVLLTRFACRYPNEGIYCFSVFTAIPVLMGFLLELWSKSNERP